jgi:hypothetical protein
MAGRKIRRMTEAERQEERSQKSADALRAMLTALATGGMGASYAVRESQRGDSWLGAAVCFALSLGCVLVSWFLVKHRAMKRRDAAAAHAKAPTFPWYKRSWHWDRAAALLLAVGVVLLAIGFNR